MPCITSLATFGNAKQACANPHTTILLQPRTSTTICSNQCATATELILTIQMANTGTTTVDGDTEQLFRPVDLIPFIAFVPTHVQNTFFKLWLFKKCKGSIGTKINFLSRKQPVGKSVKQIIKLERPKVTNICHQETQFLAYELLVLYSDGCTLTNKLLAINKRLLEVHKQAVSARWTGRLLDSQRMCWNKEWTGL